MRRLMGVAVLLKGTEHQENKGVSRARKSFAVKFGNRLTSENALDCASAAWLEQPFQAGSNASSVGGETNPPGCVGRSAFHVQPGAAHSNRCVQAHESANGKPRPGRHSAE
jgi:hypothetical protein